MTMKALTHAETGISYFCVRDDSQPPQGETVVLVIHGLGCTKRWFSAGAPLDQFSWLVPDLLGYGHSRQPSSDDELTMEAQGRALFAWASDVLRGDSDRRPRLILLAHSMGGPIGIHFVERWLAAKDSDRTFSIAALFYAEGNIDKGEQQMQRVLRADVAHDR